MNQVSRAVLAADEITWTITRMTHQLLELNQGSSGVLLLGILTRGAPLAQRLATVAHREGHQLITGQLDITMYRDDLRQHPTRPVGRSSVPGSIDGSTVVLVDDVLHSGRTVQAALHALADLGRPANIQLAVLVDRGGRQLPIQADVVGRQLPAARDERVRVQLTEIDGQDLINIERSIS